jgi:tRNA dimethylallyltransferase
LQTGRLFSQQRLRSLLPYSLLMIGLNRPREALYRRIDQRIEAMLASGFIEEVQRLVDKGYGSGLPTMSAIGYREISAVARGEMMLDEAVIQMKRRTRRYVRQQGAWFNRHDTGIHWFQVEEGVEEGVEEAIEALIRTPQAWAPKGERLGDSSADRW